jgi:pseudaminic acid cytidylyltransferase
MIQYPIEAAIKSEVFDDVVVSTDSKDIANLAISLGAQVPFIRNKALSDDKTRADTVIGNAIHELSKLGKQYESVCAILPTTPGLTSQDFIDSASAFVNLEKQYLTLFGVTEFQNTPYRAFLLDNKNELLPLFPEMLKFQTQDLAKCYVDAGQFYWASPAVWQKTESITSEKGKGWILDFHRAIDINEESDWLLAEILFKTFCN